MDNQIILYNNNRIILSHERKKKTILDIYPSNHLLTYIRERLLKVKQGSEVQYFEKGEFVLFKKFTPATITKTWCGEDIKFSSIVFTFHEDIARKALDQLQNSTQTIKTKASIERVVGIRSNPVLNHFIESLELFFDDEIKMDSHLAKLKTTEALVGLIKSDAAIAHQLRHFSVRSKADLWNLTVLNRFRNCSISMCMPFAVNESCFAFNERTGRRPYYKYVQHVGLLLCPVKYSLLCLKIRFGRPGNRIIHRIDTKRSRKYSG